MPPSRKGSVLVLLLACTGSGESGRETSRAAGSPEFPENERTALAASFVGHELGALERLLHDSVIVQPPPPDSALQGPEAIRYLRELAAHTQATESRLIPGAFTPEGPFVFEQGTWVLRAGGRALRGRYILRWRQTAEGWKVVLWGWSRFR